MMLNRIFVEPQLCRSVAVGCPFQVFYTVITKMSKKCTSKSLVSRKLYRNAGKSGQDVSALNNHK